LVAAAFAAASCGRAKPRAAPPAPPAASAALAAAREACANANIVICCTDAARRDHFGCYGYGRATTPEIDKLAAEGVRFTNAVTDATYTLGACASLFAGQYPDTHGASVAGMRIPLELTTLPEACRAAGMRTAVLTSSGVIIKPHGFGDGVDDFVRVYQANQADHQVPELQRAWRSWLDGIGDRRFFLYVHIMPPHHPYEEAGPFRGTFDPGYAGTLPPSTTLAFQLDAGEVRLSPRDHQHLLAMYDEVLAYGDWAVGTLVADLRQRGLLDKTLFILFSDHGEGFGEHGRYLHSNTVYDELTHIALIARLPSGVRGAKREVDDYVQLSDMAPTLSSLTGIRFPPGQLQGCDASPAMFDGHSRRSAAFSRCLREPRVLRSVEIPGAKGVFGSDGTLVELYDLKADPGERTNLAAAQTAFAGRVTGLWRDWAGRQQYVGRGEGRRATARGLDTETRKWLRSLGYVK
jgi:arylsulfatase A-like enzyme